MTTLAQYRQRNTELALRFFLDLPLITNEFSRSAMLELLQDAHRDPRTHNAMLRTLHRIHALHFAVANEPVKAVGETLADCRGYPPQMAALADAFAGALERALNERGADGAELARTLMQENGARKVDEYLFRKGGFENLARLASPSQR